MSTSELFYYLEGFTDIDYIFSFQSLVILFILAIFYMELWRSS